MQFHKPPHHPKPSPKLWAFPFFSSFSRPSKNVSFFGCFQTVPHRAGHLETFAESLLFVLAPLLLVLDRTAEVSQPGQRQVQGTLLAQRGATSNGIEGNSLGNS
jgi:hypothetical protein